MLGNPPAARPCPANRILRRYQMAVITVAVGDPPYGKERVYTALRFSLVALHEGHQVNLFLFEDAVFAGKRGQRPPEMPVGDSGMPRT